MHQALAGWSVDWGMGPLAVAAKAAWLDRFDWEQFACLDFFPVLIFLDQQGPIADDGRTDH
jgi:predicted trehalose synthase